MKQINKKTALLLAVLMAASTALASCNGGNNNSSNSSSPSSSTGSSADSSTGTGRGSNTPDSATVTVMIPHYGLMPTGLPTQEKWEEVMNEKLNCDITFEWNYIPYGEYGEKRNIALASADLPDIFQATPDSVTPYLDQDIILELSGYTNLMPNYMNFVSTIRDGEAKVYDAEGHFYGFKSVEVPRLEQGLGIYCVASYRYDTFEANNIKVPETTDELYDAAKKLKELYPDTYPVTRTWADTSVYTYHTSDGIFWNGEAYEYGPVTENYRKMLTYLNKLYSEGLIDPETYTEDSDMHVQKMLTGKTFISLGEWFNEDQSRNNNTESDAYWIDALAPTDPEIGTAWQQVTNVNEPNFTGGLLCINAEAENPELLIKLLDLQYEDDIIELTTWGIEGESFTRDADGKPTFLDETKQAENPWEANAKFGNRASTTRPAFDTATDTRAYVDFAANDACWIDGKVVEMPWELAWPNYSWPDSELIPPSVFTPPITWTTEESQDNSTIMTAVQTMVDEYKMKFIKGEESLDNWDSYVSAIEGMGYQEVVDRYNEKAAAIAD